MLIDCTRQEPHRPILVGRQQVLVVKVIFTKEVIMPLYRSIIALAIMGFAAQSFAQVNCSTDSLGITRCSNGQTFSTDSLEITRDNQGNSWNTDSLGITRDNHGNSWSRSEERRVG